MNIGLCLLTLPMSGVSKVEARSLGAVDGRNWELSLLTSLPIEGRALMDRTATKIQPRRTTQR